VDRPAHGGEQKNRGPPSVPDLTRVSLDLRGRLAESSGQGEGGCGMVADYDYVPFLGTNSILSANNG
jgi:hypothetical protein